MRLCILRLCDRRVIRPV